MHQLIQDIITSLQSFADPKRLALAQNYHPTAMAIIGVTNPNQKIVLKELKDITKSYSEREKINLAKELVNTHIFECQQIAYNFIGNNNKLLAALSEQDIDDLMVNMDNWVSVDCFSVYIAGYAWRIGTISTEKIKGLLQLEDFWKRRIAIVSTVALNLKSRGGMGDVDKTLKICYLAINDHSDLIIKAMSWALRELSKVDKHVVWDFIQTHEQELHPRVLREVKTKLITGKKN